jgi:hypothetical protein
MDVLVLGKKTYSSTAAPEVLYCGQSRADAREVVSKSNLAWIYEVSSLPIRNYKRSTAAALVAPTEPAPAPEAQTKKVKKNDLK